MNDHLAAMLAPPDPAPQLVHVPTVAELVAQGLAQPTHSRGPVSYRLHPEGAELIRTALAHNARVWRALNPGGDLPPRPRRRRFVIWNEST